MPLYESTFIARQDMSRQDVQKLADQLTDIVKTNGGSVVKSEYWGLRNLTHRIKKNRKGHYTMLGIDAPGEAIAELRRLMTINEDVIRSLIVKTDAISDKPSAILSEDDSYSRNSDAPHSRAPRETHEEANASVEKE